MKKSLYWLAVIFLLSGLADASSDFSGHLHYRLRYENLNNFGVNFYGPSKIWDPLTMVFSLRD